MLGDTAGRVRGRGCYLKLRNQNGRCLGMEMADTMMLAAIVVAENSKSIEELEKDKPQGLKPSKNQGIYGTTKVVP